MKFDWRKLPTTSEVNGALQGILTNIDSQGILQKEMSDEPTPRGFDVVHLSPEEHFNAVPTRMLIRWNNSGRGSSLTWYDRVFLVCSSADDSSNSPGLPKSSS